MANNLLNNQLGQMEKQLQQNNPKMYQLYQSARQQNANPSDLLKQITSGYDSNRMKMFKEQAKKMGFGDDLLNQL